MKRLVALFALLALPAHAGGKPPFACNLSAMTSAQRTQHAALAGELFAAVQEKRELPSGYALRLSPERWLDAATWAGLERRCCPFFAFSFDERSRRLEVGVDNQDAAAALDAIADGLSAKATRR